MSEIITRVGVADPAAHPTVEDLRKIHVFEDLASEDLEWLREHMQLLELKAGEIVIRAGQPAEHMSMIFSGRFAASAKTPARYLWRVPEVLRDYCPIRA